MKTDQKILVVTSMYTNNSYLATQNNKYNGYIIIGIISVAGDSVETAKNSVGKPVHRSVMFVRDATDEDIAKATLNAL